MTNDETLPRRPIPRRPETGWQAWQATVGYLYHEDSPDAMLTVTAYPVTDAAVGWSALLFWDSRMEATHNQESLGAALCRLWAQIDTSHQIFKSREAAIRRPADYEDHQWLDAPAQATLDRLLQAAAAAFGATWRIAITYQPVDNPDMRMRATLIAQNETVQLEGWGPALRDVCQTLYRHIAAYCATRVR